MIRGSNLGRETTLLSFPKCSELLLVPPSLIFNGYHHYVSGVKWPECEVNCLSLSRTEVKNGWRYKFISSICLHDVNSDRIVVAFD